MPRYCREDYTCPCCGYHTSHKTNITYHLYKMKKPCPKSLNDIELTEAIKQHILQNRIYKVPQPTNIQNNNTVNNIINQYNTVNNFVANMDFMDKLTKYITYNNIDLIDYSEQVEQKYERTRKRLEKNMMRDYKLTMNEFMEILDEVSSICNSNYEEYNIHFDEKTKKLKLYEDGTWQTLLQEVGVNKVITGLKYYFLDMYEFYLVRKIHSQDISPMQRQDFTEHLIQYYIFIACFNLLPHIKDKTDSYILSNGNDNGCDDYDDYNMSEQMMKIYIKNVDKLTVSQQNKVKKDVVDIIKRNSKQNVDELNKKVASLFNMDETFKKHILNTQVEHIIL
jgi:hypothetical protein